MNKGYDMATSVQYLNKLNRRVRGMKMAGHEFLLGVGDRRQAGRATAIMQRKGVPISGAPNAKQCLFRSAKSHVPRISASLGGLRNLGSLPEGAGADYDDTTSGTRGTTT
ncbi:hypothetical protein HBH61_227700 [Parastagonospora nodorum]|nr:hypothetical protein HBH61_227700 [Parastagonospora nodorum]